LQLLEIALLFLRRSALHPNLPRSRLLGPSFCNRLRAVEQLLPSEDWGGAGPSAALQLLFVTHGFKLGVFTGGSFHDRLLELPVADLFAIVGLLVPFSDCEFCFTLEAC